MAVKQIEEDAAAIGMPSREESEGWYVSKPATAHWTKQGDTSYLVDNVTGRVLQVVKRPDFSLSSALRVVAPVFIAYFLPVLGQAIAAELGVSNAVGTAIAQVGMSVAQGQPIDQAIGNAGINFVSQGILNSSQANALVSNLTTDPATINIIKNAASSALNTIAKGGSGQDILTNSLSAVIGTVTGQKLDSQTIGQAVATALATGGDPNKIALSIASSLGNENARPLDQKTLKLVENEVKSYVALSDLEKAINAANLTEEEKEIVRQAKQDVYSQASTAQALPSFPGTATDAPTAISRLGSAFASNDPRFQAILEKSPSIAKAFDEYTNTYGFSSPAMNVGYIELLKQELTKDPQNQTLLDEYKKFTGKDFVPSFVSGQAGDFAGAGVTGSWTPGTPITDIGELTITAPKIVASVDSKNNIAVVVDNKGNATSVSVPPNTTVGSYVTVDPKTQTATVTQPSPFVTGGTSPTTTPIPQGPEVNPIQAPAPSTSTAPTTAPAVSPTTAPQTSPQTSPTTAPVVSPGTAPSTAPAVDPTIAPAISPATSPATAPQANPQAVPQAVPQVSPAVNPLLSPALAPLAQAAPVPAPKSPSAPTAPSSPFVTGPFPGSTQTTSTAPPPPTSTVTPTTTPTASTPPEETVTPPPEQTPPPEEIPPPEKPPEEEKKPQDSINISVSAIKPPKKKTGLPTITGFGRSPLEQALSAYRPPGEVEGESGLDRQNVWNEASLRLKDALGI